MVFFILYGGAIAVPAYPPDVRQLNKSLPRIDGIVNDCGAALVFTNSNIKNALKLIRLRMPNLYFKPIIATDEISIARADEWQMPEVNAEDIAFLQYTSGSTSQPKGVMVSHKNLLHNSETIKNFYGHDHNSKGVIWLPSYHDMGLIGGLLQTIYLGVQTWLISPISFIKNPYLWLKLISEKGASTSGGPNFAYELCLKRISPEQKKNLDLSKWKIAFSGAEPVKIETINKFSEFFAECGFRKEAFYPCYGLAEATLIVTGVEKLKGPHDINLNSEFLTQNKVKLSDQSDERTLNYVSCGYSTNDQELIIVDPHTKQKLSEDEVGEVWVKGPSIALGYWKKEEATKEIFNAHTLDDEGPYLRTGDKGFLHEKELYITGRIKDLIIINGKNYYPQDIELTVEKSDKAIRGGGVVAFAIDKEGREELVVLAEMKSSELDKSGLINKIKNKVRESHELLINDLIFIKPRTIPKTSSGKLQRYLCKQLYLSGQFESNGITDKKNFIQFNSLKKWRLDDLFFKRDRSIEITARNIEKWFVERVAQELKIPSKEVDVKKPISSYLDSVLMVGVAGDLSLWLKSNFDPAHFVGSHSIESIAQSYSNKSNSKKNKKLYNQFNHLNKMNPLSIKLKIKNVLL
jgi:acyl-CoA synthetase (AMP-forming)/AMP-acid ligase II